MYGIITHVPCSPCSFTYIIQTINNNLTDYTLIPVVFSVGKLNISDAYHFFNSFQHHKERDDIIIWVDTPIHITKKFPDFKGKVYTTSSWNAEMIREAGVHVDGIVPRPIDEKTISKTEVKTKDLDFVMIGANIRTNDKKWFKVSRYVYMDNDTVIYDKKNVKLYRLVKGKKVLVSHDSFADIKYHSLTQEEKYLLLARARFYLALSHSEGFGLPPVEAMGVGTIPIFPECHAYKDWLIGLSVKCQGYDVIDTPAMPHRFYYFDEKEMLELTEYARGMKREDYEELSRKIKKHAEKFYVKEVIKQLQLF
ncbi:putative glycosyltransferase [Sulfolobales Beppu filamentous phage 1]|uniref:Putative glycosyltransferase n=1 Tax=Sulfolobales Beppu filamentous phage 1 TaxID=2493122 RepID=A0A3Q8Q3L9_9VIRU|nr:putative glycosyltransferase [Sulfolobales Beppu filamentous phage 1]